MSVFIARRWDITKELAALWEATKELPRGSVVEHKTIEKVTGKTKDKSPWQQIIGKWKKKMRLERGIEPVAIGNGVGYRFPAADEQNTKVADAIERRGLKAIRKAAVVAGVIPEAELSETGRLYQKARVDQLGEQIKLAQTQKAIRQSWLSSPETLPRITNNG